MDQKRQAEETVEQAGEQDLKPAGEVPSLELFEAEEQEPLEEPEEQEPTTKAVFIDEDYNRYKKSIRHQGYIFDKLTQEPIPGLDITEFCDGDEVGMHVTSNKGYFDVVYDCQSGYEAWLEVTYEGITVDSEHVYIPEPIIKRSSSRGSTSSQ